MGLKNKVILVTGGAGYVGSHLCEHLREGNQVWSLDNYSNGFQSNHVEGVRYVRGDTRNIAQLIQCDPDYVFHLGEYSRVEQSLSEPRKVWDYNVAGTFGVLEFCRDRGSKLIYCGSSTKFGDGGLARTQTPYGWTKASNTELVSNYGEWYSLKYAITYFYNVFGGRELRQGPYATLIGIYAENMLQGKPLPVVLPGTQTRNFTHITDVIRGLVLVGEYGSGDNYGLGNKQSYSILDVAELFGGVVEYLPARRGNRISGELVTDKTEALGWSAEACLEDYVNELRSRQ